MAGGSPPHIPVYVHRPELWEIGYSVPRIYHVIVEEARQKLPDAAIALQFVYAENPLSTSHSFAGTYHSTMVSECPEPANAGRVMTGNAIDLLFNASETTYFLSLLLDWHALRIQHRLVRLMRPRGTDLRQQIDLLPPMPEPGDEIVDTGEIRMDKQYLLTANALIDRMLLQVGLPS